ncbi:hypothetical protein BDW75DRAFT_235646 [Aspergillus navahoensis]
MVASHSHNMPSRIHIRINDSLIIAQRSQALSSDDHKPRQDCLYRVRHLSKEQCRLTPDSDDHPSSILELWRAVSRRSPETATNRKAMEQPSSRIHSSRSVDSLKACDCPSPEQGPLCVAPSVKTSLPSRIMEWTNWLGKQAITLIHDSDKSPSDLHLIMGARDCFTTSSNPNETIVTIHSSSTIAAEDELLPGTIDKITPQRPTDSLPSDTGSFSIPPSVCSSERENRSRIEVLKAKRYSLIRRRESIEKAIYDLMWPSGPYSAPYDMNAREEVKKTIARLSSELADIRREDHNIGLKLFRALKSRDEADYCGGKSASLWVSRVTR